MASKVREYIIVLFMKCTVVFFIEYGEKLKSKSDNSIKEKFEIFEQAPKMCDFWHVESPWSIIKADVAKYYF